VLVVLVDMVAHLQMTYKAQMAAVRHFQLSHLPVVEVVAVLVISLV
jgi:hypothetical protein